MGRQLSPVHAHKPNLDVYVKLSQTHRCTCEQMRSCSTPTPWTSILWSESVEGKGVFFVINFFSSGQNRLPRAAGFAASLQRRTRAGSRRTTTPWSTRGGRLSVVEVAS